jgi:biopolymer transport protein ExbD
MRFITRKPRNPPSVIIVSLIDVLIVVLIFMMVATTFRQHPALRLALPESRQSAKPGDTGDTLIITIMKEEPHLYLDLRPVTLEKLLTELKASTARNPQVSLSIRADTGAPFGEVVKVMDAAKEAGITMVNAFTKNPAQK